jgi:hypothetical protein
LRRSEPAPDFGPAVGLECPRALRLRQQDPTQPQNRTYRKDAVAGQKKLNLQSGCREMAASERWQHQVSNRNENPGVMVEEEGKRKAAGDSERDRCRAVPEVNP